MEEPKKSSRNETTAQTELSRIRSLQRQEGGDDGNDEGGANSEGASRVALVVLAEAGAGAGKGVATAIEVDGRGVRVGRGAGNEGGARVVGERARRVGVAARGDLLAAAAWEDDAGADVDGLLTGGARAVGRLVDADRLGVGHGREAAAARRLVVAARAADLGASCGGNGGAGNAAGRACRVSASGGGGRLGGRVAARVAAAGAACGRERRAVHGSVRNGGGQKRR